MAKMSGDNNMKVYWCYMSGDSFSGVYVVAENSRKARYLAWREVFSGFCRDRDNYIYVRVNLVKDSEKFSYILDLAKKQEQPCVLDVPICNKEYCGVYLTSYEEVEKGICIYCMDMDKAEFLTC